jgi:hypothetical protein
MKLYSNWWKGFIYIYFYISKDENGVVIPETMRYFIDGGTEGFNG